MLRFLIAGESPGSTLTGILDGMPAGLSLSSAVVDVELRLRHRGLGCGGRMKIEWDHVRISAGVLAGEATGAPVALQTKLSTMPSGATATWSR